MKKLKEKLLKMSIYLSVYWHIGYIEINSCIVRFLKRFKKNEK